jgi:uncharacterized membrane protein
VIARAAPDALLAAALCLAGVAISAYLTSVHYQDVPLACSTNGVVDCEAVLHSSYASVAGVPVALFGVGWFGVMGVLAVRPVSPLALAWAAAGALTVVWLVYVELFRVDRICLWCTAVHGLVLATGTLVLHAATRPARLS